MFKAIASLKFLNEVYSIRHKYVLGNFIVNEIFKAICECLRKIYVYFFIGMKINQNGNIYVK